MKFNKKKLKKIAFIVLFEILFLTITTPILFLYGPYDSLRKMAISTVLATRHSYLIDKYIPKSVVNKVFENEITQEASAATLSDKIDTHVEIKHKNDNEIIRYNIQTDSFDGYLLEIKDPTKIKVAMTKELGKSGQKTSDMAKDNNAIAAINGGSFVDESSDGTKYAGTGSYPGGYVISDGKVIYPTSDIDENQKENVLAFTKSGHLIVGDRSIKELKEMDVKEAICFRPPTLIINGKRQIKDKYEGGLNPRTAIGQKADGTVLFLVIDGRKSLTKMGATLYDVQEVLLDYGAINAGNLDGGYSSTMYYEGEVINSPNSWNGERTVATAFYVEK